MTFTLPQVLVLFCALLAASLGVVALLLLRWNRTRAELGLYAVLAFAVAFWLATPLLAPVPIPLSGEILGRLERALSFLLPAAGFLLFLLRLLGLAATGLRLVILLPAPIGVVLALTLPATAAWLDAFSVFSLVVVSTGIPWILSRPENRRRDTLLALAATGILVAGGAVEIASRQLPEARPASGVLLGTAFLAFTALLLPDRGRRGASRVHARDDGPPDQPPESRDFPRARPRGDLPHGAHAPHARARARPDRRLRGR